MSSTQHLFSIASYILLITSALLAASTKEFDAEVLILDGGMAGISAAKSLVDNNITDFMILEAEDHIGGRVKNKVLKSSGVRVELGANWISGIDPTQPDKHPLWKIAQKCQGLKGEYQSRTMHL